MRVNSSSWFFGLLCVSSAVGILMFWAVFMRLLPERLRPEASTALPVASAIVGAACCALVGLGIAILLPSLKAKRRSPSEGLILLRDGGSVKGFKQGVVETIPRGGVGKPVQKMASKPRRLKSSSHVKLGYIKYAVILAIVLEAYLALAYAFKTFTPIVVVCSGSMRPTLEVGDLVLVEGVDAWSIREGDIVVFNVPQPYAKSTPSPVIHRVIKVVLEDSLVYFKTKGDANGSEDPWTVAGGDVVGRLKYRIPYMGIPVYVLKTNPYVFAIVVALFAVWLAYSIFKGRWG